MPETKNTFALLSNRPKRKAEATADTATPAKKGKPKTALLPVRTPEEAQVEHL